MESTNKNYSKAATSVAPLTLSSNAIKDFQKVYFEEYKIHLSEDMAKHLALKWLKVFKLIAKPTYIAK